MTGLREWRVAHASKDPFRTVNVSKGSFRASGPQPRPAVRRPWRMGKLLSRRAVLVGGIGGLGVVAAAGAGALADVLPGGARLRGLLGLTGPDGEVPDVPAGPVYVERVRS